MFGIGPSDWAVDRVLFPTWSSYNGQDDLVWHKMSSEGIGHGIYTYTVDLTTHAPAKAGYEYVTDVYADDIARKSWNYRKNIDLLANGPDDTDN